MHMNKNVITGIIIVIILVALGWYMWSTDINGTNTNGNATTTVTNQSPINSGNNTATSTDTAPVEPAAAAARSDLAAKLGISAQSIIIMEVENQTWNNGCLGLPKAGEFCTEALVPGFKVEMEAQGESYTYRTNASGSVVRMETK